MYQCLLNDNICYIYSADNKHYYRAVGGVGGKNAQVTWGELCE